MRGVLILVIAVGLIFAGSVPAPAAEKTVEERIKALEDTIGGWSFYGSARFATFYEKSDSNAFNDTDGITDLNGPHQKTTRWGISDSYVGATATKGDFGGKIEIEFEENQTLETRLMYGTYTSHDVTLLLGQDYTPLGDWSYSNQVFAEDNAMQGWGMIYEDTIPQLKLKWKGLQVAFVENMRVNTAGLNASDVRTEIVLPHLEMKYHFEADKFFGDVFGGANTYKVKAASLNIDKTINSYALGAGCGVTIDPVYANTMVWMARNGMQMGLHQADAQGAQIDPETGRLTNDNDLGWVFIVGAHITKVTLEAGYGYVKSKLDASGARKDDAQNCYLQAVIPVAQTDSAKFSLTPEIGVVDYKRDSKGDYQGKAIYAGARWQIDF